MGTGGTVTGAGHFLKEKNSEIKVVSISVCLCVCEREKQMFFCFNIFGWFSFVHI